MKQLILSTLLLVGVQTHTSFAQAPSLAHYSGAERSLPAFHDGHLIPVVGVHNIQTMRANRQQPTAANGYGWTYNHQPMIVHWGKTFWMHYLADPVGEHIPPSKTFIQRSNDGYAWEAPEVLFPEYKVPDGYTKPDNPGVAKDLYAIMHQRVGFFVAKNGRLLAIGNYGIALDQKDDPNDGNGVGRVVREIRKDGSFGPIHFIYYNHRFNEKNTDFPFYKKSKDKGFVAACEQMLADPLQWMQWVEEADREDPRIPLAKGFKGFCYYSLPNDTIVSFWKHALTSVSGDGGRTWAEPVARAKGFVNSNAKIWGQRLSDGTYATVYNPSEYRWPLALSLSQDGLNYTTLNVIHSTITPMRYGGNYKSCGPQYVRGIQECNGSTPDGDMWLTYSVNKEDMWVCRVPVPVRSQATDALNETFATKTKLADLADWNLYMPAWAPISLVENGGQRWLRLADRDLFDHARAERLVPAAQEMKVEFDFVAEQLTGGEFYIEFADARGTVCTRLQVNPDGKMMIKNGARYSNVLTIEPNRTYRIGVELSVANRTMACYVDGQKKAQRIFYQPVSSIERIRFRTGLDAEQPTPETQADRYTDLPGAGDEGKPFAFRIGRLRSSSLDPGASSAILPTSIITPYVDYFNRMEDENIVQAIPNVASATWMERNIPLFDCPQENFRQMYYFRWWNLRKHIKQTPVGYGMTEFLVNRSYADQHNLIACAIGHHIYDSRWIIDTTYLNSIVHTWYRGNEGNPMKKMMNFSSWNIDALWNFYLARDNRAYLLDLLPDMEAEYARWEAKHRLPNGLYWQGDVQDGMEESLSGGRRKKYMRPTINSYMYGNARALASIYELVGNRAKQELFNHKADTLRRLVETQLWNEKNRFFETHRSDSLANVREAIGYIPWYFNLPTEKKFDQAWLQLLDPTGFSAPMGLTTAERRHPLFRTHGTGKCEWDGAIWPFATAQTLTALANYLNHTTSPVVTDSTFFRQMELYVESSYHRGRPYIGEYLDEVTGYWLKGDQERSRYYNHSTFNDLIITGLCGLRPRADRQIEVNPLVPNGRWDYFCLDRIPYHGQFLTILWDKSGTRYHQGKGLRILVNGKPVGHRADLGRLVVSLP